MSAGTLASERSSAVDAAEEYWAAVCKVTALSPDEKRVRIARLCNWKIGEQKFQVVDGCIGRARPPEQLNELQQGVVLKLSVPNHPMPVDTGDRGCVPFRQREDF